jgi:hypothetical protein
VQAACYKNAENQPAQMEVLFLIPIKRKKLLLVKLIFITGRNWEDINGYQIFHKICNGIDAPTATGGLQNCN